MYYKFVEKENLILNLVWIAKHTDEVMRRKICARVDLNYSQLIQMRCREPGQLMQAPIWAHNWAHWPRLSKLKRKKSNPLQLTKFDTDNM